MTREREREEWEKTLECGLRDLARREHEPDPPHRRLLHVKDWERAANASLARSQERRLLVTERERTRLLPRDPRVWATAIGLIVLGYLAIIFAAGIAPAH